MRACVLLCAGYSSCHVPCGSGHQRTNQPLGMLRLLNFQCGKYGWHPGTSKFWTYCFTVRGFGWPNRLPPLSASIESAPVTPPLKFPHTPPSGARKTSPVEPPTTRCGCQIHEIQEPALGGVLDLIRFRPPPGPLAARRLRRLGSLHLGHDFDPLPVLARQQVFDITYVLGQLGTELPPGQVRRRCLVRP